MTQPSESDTTLMSNPNSWACFYFCFTDMVFLIDQRVWKFCSRPGVISCPAHREGRPHLEGDLRVLHQEHLELTDADAEVARGELVGNVEAKRAELAPLDDHAVEEGEGQHQALELMGLREGGRRGKREGRGYREILR